MGVYATILYLQHPDELVRSLGGAGAGLTGTREALDPEGKDLGSPWAYRGSHVIPDAGDERRGLVELGAIPAFVEDARRGAPEEDHREGDLPWLRLSVQTHALAGQGDEATVVLDRAQAAELRDALDEWLQRSRGR